jgi:uncharacterized SAM-binding protein YcdF (DUF218 family)
MMIEDKSTTTYENAIFTRQLIDSTKPREPFVLVTSAIHMRRAVGTFTKAGIKVVPYPSDFEPVYGDEYITTYILPNGEVLNKWKYLIKEMLGLVAYKISGKA